MTMQIYSSGLKFYDTPVNFEKLLYEHLVSGIKASGYLNINCDS